MQNFGIEQTFRGWVVFGIKARTLALRAGGSRALAPWCSASFLLRMGREVCLLFKPAENRRLQSGFRSPRFNPTPS